MKYTGYYIEQTAVGARGSAAMRSLLRWYEAQGIYKDPEDILQEAEDRRRLEYIRAKRESLKKKGFKRHQNNAN